MKGIVKIINLEGIRKDYGLDKITGAAYGEKDIILLDSKGKLIAIPRKVIEEKYLIEKRLF